MDKNLSVYFEAVSCFIKDKDAAVLVCGAHLADKEVFYNAGFRNVLLSGMDESKVEYAPYVWVKENAMALSFDDSSFDYVVVHSALHHMSSPHRALTEMYRVAKKGVIVFEGRDSFLIRTAAKFGLTQKFEVAGAFPTSGVDGTNVPTYIFRWTEREVEKTISAFSPAYRHRFSYRYWSLYPDGPDLSVPKKTVMKFLRPFFLFVCSSFSETTKRNGNLYRKTYSTRFALPLVVCR